MAMKTHARLNQQTHTSPFVLTTSCPITCPSSDSPNPPDQTAVTKWTICPKLLTFPWAVQTWKTLAQMIQVSKYYFSNESPTFEELSQNIIIYLLDDTHTQICFDFFFFFLSWIWEIWWYRNDFNISKEPAKASLNKDTNHPKFIMEKWY